METKVVIRLAVGQDVVDIGNVARSTWNDTYAGIILPENQERLLGRWYIPSALHAAITQRDSWFFVAAVREYVMGFAQFILRENNRGDLTRIYVLPEWQRRGVGDRLLKEGLAALTARGAEEVFVQVEKDNAKGIGFYEREGFRLAREFSFELPGQNLKFLEYVFSLGER
jgi:ribosomal protein S18 acetylase RimI-like enzyme